MSGRINVVEHVVLFKVRQDAPEEKKLEMVRELNALKSLEGVLHLRAGPASSLWPASRALASGFTHILHSRYSDKAGLQAYAVHPSHVRVVENFVKPVAEDLLAMDWEAQLEAPLVNEFAAKRLVACKLKAEGGSGVSGLLGALSEDHQLQVKASFGPNFSPGRAKGFNFGCMTFFSSVKELQEAGDPEKLVSRIGGSSSVDELIVLDYETEGDASKM